MFTGNLNEFKLKEKELISRAEHYRLVKSLSEPRQRSEKLRDALGRTLIRSGQILMTRTQTAH
jgi:hypothetical protein